MKKTSLTILTFASGVFSLLAQQIDFVQNSFTPGDPGAVLGALTGTSNNNGLQQLITLLRNVVNSLIPILVTLGLLAFFWFLVLFIWKGADNPTERQKGVSGMGWSILALFVMVSIWGLIGFIGSVTGIPQGGTMHGFILPGKTN